MKQPGLLYVLILAVALGGLAFLFLMQGSEFSTSGKPDSAVSVPGVPPKLPTPSGAESAASPAPALTTPAGNAKKSAGGKGVKAETAAALSPQASVPSAPAATVAPAIAGAAVPARNTAASRFEDRRDEVSGRLKKEMQEWREKHLQPGGNGEGSRKGNLAEGTDREGRAEAAKAERGIPFTARFVGENKVPLPGVQILWSSSPGGVGSDPQESQNSGLLVPITSPLLVGSSGDQGQVKFILPESEFPNLLTAKYGDFMGSVFFGPVNASTAWNGNEIEIKGAKPRGAMASGTVLDYWRKPMAGVLVANDALIMSGNQEKLIQFMMLGGIIFTRTNADGTYLLAGLKPDAPLVISCAPTGMKPQARENLVAPAEGAILKGIDFFFEEAAVLAGRWKGVVKTLEGTTVPNLPLSFTRYENLAAAVQGRDVFFTGPDGSFEVPGIEPGREVILFLFQQLLGVQELGRHTFKEGELHEGEYTVNLGGDKPGSLRLRLQSDLGFNITEGIIATKPVFTAAELKTWIEQDGQGTVLNREGETLLEGLAPRLEFEVFYANELMQQTSLGRFTLLSGEQRDLGLLRVADTILIPAEIQGTIITAEGKPVPDLAVTATTLTGEKLASATTGAAGEFVLRKLPRMRLVRISGRDGEGREQELVSELLVKEAFMGGQTWVWVPDRPFNVVVKDQSGPVEGARVSLYYRGATDGAEQPLKGYEQGLLSDKTGLATLSGLKAGAAYTLKVFHPFYEPRVVDPFAPDMKALRAEVVLEPRPGIKVRLAGPDFTPGIHVRSWIGVLDRDGLIVPDYKTGNEYEETLTRPEILFEVPPREKFWIYVGALADPWGSGLHGPYQPELEKIIEIAIEKVGPLTLDASASITKGQEWDFMIYGKDRQSGLLAQLKSGVYYWGRVVSDPLYLAQGLYHVRVQSAAFENHEFDFENKGEASALKLELKPRERIPPAGGQVKGLLVSDTFPLALSNKTIHNEEMYYGYNKDFLAHLGGENLFVARQLGDYPALDGSARITWREVVSENGFLNFMRPDLYPGRLGNYVVAYVQFQVDALYDENLLMGISSDDGFKAWVNGRLVLHAEVARSAVQWVDQDTAAIHLKKGINQFNFKVDNSWGGWVFGVRFLDPATLNPRTNLKIMPDQGFAPIQEVHQPEMPESLSGNETK